MIVNYLLTISPLNDKDYGTIFGVAFRFFMDNV
jgi:hypothetical protein